MSERRIRNNRIRRQRERRKNILLFILTVCFALSLSVSAGSFLSNAKEHNIQTEYKYYASIPVTEGDTLWSIAKTHMGDHYDTVEDYIKELCQINSLNENDTIKTGMYLVVPYYSAESVQ
ncbi:MAG: LysM peptidoglycan-binding domain-containing protein [Lachnospiraceae bacterium]|nr:LysM peptidoglycan-binding domain-containing protein [Lachnospiraceae bacterium]